jgi:molybdopterin/thiamine biosynthesis adenylyltransferase
MTLPLRQPLSVRSCPLPAELWSELNRTQAGIQGFDLARNQAARVLQIGAGGIGTHVATGLIMKALGALDIFDDDVVELTNLTRQLFDRHDVGQFKATALARRLAREALFPTVIRAHPRRFQEMLEAATSSPRYDLIICGVDNNPTRRAAAAFGLRHRIPVIHAAISHDGNALYVMVQDSKPGTPCWGCALPEELNDGTFPCGLPGIVDVLQVVSGVIVYAVDTVLSGRPREWNIRYFYLDAGMPERVRTLPPRPGCALCTGHNLWLA